MGQRTQQGGIRDADWPAYIACLLAFAGLTIAVLFGFSPHTSQNAGSDFKTLYASAWCFVHGLDAYQFPNLAQVFHSNSVIVPRSWYGHSPVYPPLTLALLTPITWLPMVPAIYVWIILSAACMALATLALVHAAGRRFGLNLPMKILLVAMAAGSPLLEIGLELANVSVVSAALCTFAVATPRSFNPWIRAVALAVALLLKPHIALWITLAFLLTFSREDRKIFWYTCIVIAAFVALFTMVGLLHPFAFTQFASYRQIVLSELSNGSMSPGNRDVMEVFVQMTSLSVLLGYWLWQHMIASFLDVAILLLIAASLAWTCWKLRDGNESRLIQAAAAWSAFGLMATYHRDADAMILVLLLPILLMHLRRNWKDVWAWCALAVVLAGCFGPSADSLHRYLDPAPPSSVLRFLLLRQASLAIAILTFLLVGRAIFQLRSRRAELTEGL